MSEEKKSENSAVSEDVFSSMSKVASQLHTIEKFIARRFDELSMEINATAQQIDMNDDTMKQKFSEIFEVLKAISYSGDGSTAANAGVELDAVVDMTEQAANTILDAADRISQDIQKSKDAASEDERKAFLESVNGHVEEIFMACSFQDITGQRIKQTLENLRMIEDRLGTTLKKIGIVVDDVRAENHSAIANKLSNQSEIDDFFSSESAKK